MTAVRPENAAGGGAGSGQPRYRDPADFAHAVEQLADPLSDPLPGAAAPQDGGWYGQQAQHQVSQQHPQHPQQPQPPHQDYGRQQQYPQQSQQPYPHQGHAPSPAQHQAQGYPAAYDPYAGGYPPQTQQAQAQQAHAPQQAPPAQSPQAAAQAPVTGYEAQSPYERPESAYERPGAAYEPAYESPRGSRRSARLESTARLPQLDDPDAPDSDPRDPHEASDGQDGRAQEPPAPGGRAERRKAARRGGRRGAGALAETSAAGDPAAGSGDGLPASRMEAKRAARAAKSSSGVIASQVTGELFITMGVLMLLFVVYQLWYTNVLADEAAGSAATSLQHQWADKKASSDANEPSRFAHGTPFAMIYIPKLDVKAPIAEGVDKSTILDRGEVGHYDGSMETAMPWAKSGNFALAGHRNTHGEPFRKINKLVAGDKVVVETSGMYYTYQITSMLPQTSPSNVSVIEPVPPGSGFTGPGRYITLTTCTPEFTSEFRLIVWGKMVAEQPRTKGTPAALLGG